MKNPYFKFDVDAYLSGEIMFCSPAAQGAFIVACALYWKCDRVLPLTKLSKRLAFATNSISENMQSLDSCIEELKDAGVINIIDGHITIKFLNDLHLEMVERSQINAESGRKGGQAKAKRKHSEDEANA